MAFLHPAAPRGVHSHRHNEEVSSGFLPASLARTRHLVFVPSQPNAAELRAGGAG